MPPNQEQTPSASGLQATLIHSTTSKQQGARQRPGRRQGLGQHQPPSDAAGHPRMCFPIDCWLCMPHTDDDDLAPASRAQPPPPPPAQRNGSHYNADAEADRKASNNARRGPAHHGATSAQAKSAYPYAADGDGAPKQQPAAPNGRVAAADGHGARAAPRHDYERAQPPARKEDAADSYYPGPAATAAAYRERY